METRKLNVKLISFPMYPMATLFYVWEQSRTNNPLPSAREIDELLKCTYPKTLPEDEVCSKTALMLGGVSENGYVNVGEVRDRIQDTITQILDEDIPCTENLNFVFAIENMPISLREQMVRHRIGVQIGERTGIDIVPDIPSSSWWSQTMRMLPMDKFFTEGRFVIPSSLKNKQVMLNRFRVVNGNTEYIGQMPAEDLYLQLMQEIEFVYNRLVQSGVAMEDARQIIPIGASHGITWSVNLKSLMHIVGKRACWVAQVNLWEDLIAGMVDELTSKVDSRLRKIILPPCFKKGKYKSCPYFQINKERVQGRDHMPPCPLYVNYETSEAIDASANSLKETGLEPTWTPPSTPEPDPETGRFPDNSSWSDVRNWNSKESVEVEMLKDGITRFERLWKLNVLTGDPIIQHENQS